MLTLSKCKPLSFRFPISMKCWTFIHGSITENIILIWWQYNSAYQAWRGTWILLQSCKTADFNLAALGCCGLECMCPSKILHWKLIPKVMVLGVGILGGSGLKQWCEQITNTTSEFLPWGHFVLRRAVCWLRLGWVKCEESRKKTEAPPLSF